MKNIKIGMMSLVSIGLFMTGCGNKQGDAEDRSRGADIKGIKMGMSSGQVEELNLCKKPLVNNGIFYDCRYKGKGYISVRLNPESDMVVEIKRKKLLDESIHWDMILDELKLKYGNPDVTCYKPESNFYTIGWGNIEKDPVRHECLYHTKDGFGFKIFYWSNHNTLHFYMHDYSLENNKRLEELKKENREILDTNKIDL
ncbi:MAG: hypothetical protein U9Q33_07005 [Campylobacterota bacterium]|nr:hypothetical protein [Campylobacterota bacterium]